MAEPDLALPSLRACTGCGHQLPSTLLACPACRRLVHADELRQLAADAEGAEKQHDLERALHLWERCLALVPHGTRQQEQLQERLGALRRRFGTTTGAHDHTARNAWMKRFGAFGAVGLALWKFKWLLAFALTKGKVLLLGLTKAPTLFSLFFTFGAYMTLFGWKFAAGLVITTYIHEIGHVVAFRRFGIPTDPVMFVPGLGAFVRGRARFLDAHVHARVSLAGPMWGLGAAVACAVIAHVTKSPAFAAIAHLAAWINVVNLLPVWVLDGAGVFKALTRRDRWTVAAVAGGAWLATHETLALVLGLVAAWQAFAGRDAAEEQDFSVLAQLVAVVLALCAVAAVDPILLTPR